VNPAHKPVPVRELSDIVRFVGNGILNPSMPRAPSVILTHAASFTGSPQKLGAQGKRDDAQNPKDNLPCRAFDFYAETLKLNRTLGLSKKNNNRERDNCRPCQSECGGEVLFNQIFPEVEADMIDE
jgi:hypothetical protein